MLSSLIFGILSKKRNERETVPLSRVSGGTVFPTILQFALFPVTMKVYAFFFKLLMKELN